MTWRREEFRGHYRDAIGTIKSSNSYVSYLNLVDKITGGLDEMIEANGVESTIAHLDATPTQIFSRARSRSNCHSALSAYTNFITLPHAVEICSTVIETKSENTPDDEALRCALLREAKDLGARYYRLTGKPLGVTGEVAELEAAEKLSLTLEPPRTSGHDAIDALGRRVQIKGRAVGRADRYRGRCPAIKGEAFDTVILVLLDRETLDAMEIWEAPTDKIQQRLNSGNSVARNIRRSLAITQFKSIANLIWPETLAKAS